MTEPTLFPADLSALSVHQLAALPAIQKAEIARHLQEAHDWVTQELARFQAALALCYGERAEAVRRDAEKPYGVIRFNDDPVQVSVKIPKCITWDQSQLTAIAKRIGASGQRIEDFLDVTYGVDESRFSRWSPVLRKPFRVARSVQAGKPEFRLSLTEGGTV